jgi:small-conductance mechanosensitive channel
MSCSVFCIVWSGNRQCTSPRGCSRNQLQSSCHRDFRSITNSICLLMVNRWSFCVFCNRRWFCSPIAYFVFNYFLTRTADSLNLDKWDQGIRSISIMAHAILTIIFFHFSNVSGMAASSLSVAAGTIIGFSSRNTISNAIAGLLLL